LHADGRTDGQTDRHDEANSRFYANFANVPKKCFDTDVVLRSNNLIFQEVQKTKGFSAEGLFYFTKHYWPRADVCNYSGCPHLCKRIQ